MTRNYKRPLGFKAQKGIRLPGYRSRWEHEQVDWTDALTEEQRDTHRRIERAKEVRWERDALTYLAKYRSLLDLTKKEMRHLREWAVHRDHEELSHELHCGCEDTARVCFAKKSAEFVRGIAALNG